MPPPAIRKNARRPPVPRRADRHARRLRSPGRLRRGTLTRVGTDGNVDCGRRPWRRAQRSRRRSRRPRLRLQQRRIRVARAPGRHGGPRQPAGDLHRRQHSGGRPRDRQVEVLYRRCGDVLLKGPNDLVFDRSGGFWFTDHGKNRERDRDRTGVFYARPDGSSIVEAIFPVGRPNGLGLSPEGDRLYVAETYRAHLLLGPRRTRDPSAATRVRPTVATSSPAWAGSNSSTRSRSTATAMSASPPSSTAASP